MRNSLRAYTPMIAFLKKTYMHKEPILDHSLHLACAVLSVQQGSAVQNLKTLISISQTLKITATLRMRTLMEKRTL